MNNLFTELSSTVGFNSVLVPTKEQLPYTLNDVKIKLNDILSTENFNFSLSALYTNFLSVATKSYFYNSQIPVTNPFLEASNNNVNTLCGTFVPYPGSEEIFNYNVNGIIHSLSAFNTIYDTHDFYINDDYLTIAVGVLSSGDLSSENNFDNKYYSKLLLLNYSLSSLYSSTNIPYSAGFGDQGIDYGITPNHSLVYSDITGNNLYLTKIKKLKFFNKNLYLLDSGNNSFVQIDTSDFIINRGITSSYKLPRKKLGFLIPSNFSQTNIEAFAINKNYFIFYNYIKNAFTVFSNSFVKLYDYYEPSITLNGKNDTESFADFDFSPNGDLYVLTKKGKIYNYSITDEILTLKDTFTLNNKTVLNTENFSPSLSTFFEVFTNILFSKSDEKIYYVSTERNIYKKFISNNQSVGQFNTNILNTTYFSTLSGEIDTQNTLTTAFPDYQRNTFLKYKIRELNSLKVKDKELVSVGFTDNCTYIDVTPNTLIENVTPQITFNQAFTSSGLNPVSASGISLFVDSPNFINLNNEDLSNINIYDFDDIKVKNEEFVTDFSINKSLRKLLYTIFNFQTFLVYKPIILIDVNNNPVYKKLEYISTYLKDQDYSNFDNFVGINEINSTAFINRCFTKIYNLIDSINNNITPDVRDIFPRFIDTIQITNNEDNFVILFEDSKQYITGSYKPEYYPLNKNICLPLPSPTPTTAPQATGIGSSTYTPTPTPTGGTVSPTPTPSPAPSAPVATASVYKTIKHTVDISLDNKVGMPLPQEPFGTSNYTMSALYTFNNTNKETLISKVDATFDAVNYSIDLLKVNGDYYKLIGKKYGDYTMTLYTSATNTKYKVGGRAENKNYFDSPARVVWEGLVTVTGIREYDSINIVTNEENAANVFSTFEDVTGTYYDESTGGVIDNSIRYSITDTENDRFRSTFNFSFSAFRGPILSRTVMIGANYINNDTGYDLQLTMNSSNVNLAPTFNFYPSFPSGSSSDSNIIIVPAGARNYPVVLWCKAYTGHNEIEFDFDLNIVGLSSTSISVSGNYARY